MADPEPGRIPLARVAKRQPSTDTESGTSCVSSAEFSFQDFESAHGHAVAESSLSPSSLESYLFSCEGESPSSYGGVMHHWPERYAEGLKSHRIPKETLVYITCTYR